MHLFQPGNRSFRWKKRLESGAVLFYVSRIVVYVIADIQPSIPPCTSATLSCGADDPNAGHTQIGLEPSGQG
jgi:hypothetical protein